MKRERIEAIPKRVEVVLLAEGRFATKPGIDLTRFLDNVLESAAISRAAANYRNTIAKVSGGTTCSKRGAGCTCTTVTMWTTMCFWSSSRRKTP